MVVAFVAGSGKNEHYTDGVRGVWEIDAVNGPDENDVEFLLSVDDDVGYCKSGLNYGSGLCFAVEEFFEEDIFTYIEFGLEYFRDLSRDLFEGFSAFYVEDLALFDEAVESVFDYLVAFHEDIAELIFESDGFQLFICDSFDDV